MLELFVKRQRKTPLATRLPVDKLVLAIAIAHKKLLLIPRGISSGTQ
jgi:hypothetical protein